MLNKKTHFYFFIISVVLRKKEKDSSLQIKCAIAEISQKRQYC